MDGHLVKLVNEIIDKFRTMMRFHVENVAQGYSGDLLSSVDGRKIHHDCPANYQAVHLVLFGMPVGPENFTDLLEKALRVVDFPGHGFKVVNYCASTAASNAANIIVAFPQFSAPTEEAPHTS